MSWKDILKQDITLNDMIKILYEDFIEDLERFGRRYESPYGNDGRLQDEAEEFDKFMSEFNRLDPITQEKQIDELYNNFSNSMYAFTEHDIMHPILPIEYEDSEIKERYENRLNY